MRAVKVRADWTCTIDGGEQARGQQAVPGAYVIRQVHPVPSR